MTKKVYSSIGSSKGQTEETTSSWVTLGPDFFPTSFVDRNYSCVNCKQPSVFTAELQRQAYEVGKKDRNYHRVLCSNCFLKHHELKAAAIAYQRQWAAEKAKLSNNTVFLRNWLQVLRGLEEAGAKTDDGNINMILRLLANSAA